MNDLRAAIRTVMTNDSATLGALLGGATRIYPANTDREIPLTESLPGFVAYGLADIGRRATNAAGQAELYRLTLHAVAIDEPHAWSISNRLLSLFHNKRISATGRGVLNTRLAAQNHFPVPALGGHEIVAEIMLGPVFAR